MVATLVRLRWRLTLNALSRNVWALVGSLLAAVQGVGLLALLVLGAGALGAWAPQAAGAVLVGVGALTVLGWMLVPLLLTGVDSTLDPRALAAWIAPSRSLALGLLAAGATGVPGLLTGVATLLPVLCWVVAGRPGAALLALVLAPVVLATCVVGSRVVVIGSGVSTSRRGREVLGLVGMVAVLVASQLPTLFNAVADAENLELERLSAWAWRLGYTPFGWAVAAPAHLAAGRYGTALVLALAAVALPVALLPLWGRIVGQVMVAGGGRGARPARAARSLGWRTPGEPGRADVAAEAVNTGSPGGATASAAVPTDAVPQAAGGAVIARRTLAWHRRLSRLVPSPAAAVAARCLRYWRSDPRYLAMAVVIVTIPTLLVLVGLVNMAQDRVRVEIGEEALRVDLSLGHAPAPLMLLPVLTALIAGWALHNDLGTDSTAQWMHLSAGLRGRDDRLGRSLAASLWQLPTVLLLLVAAAVWTGRWDMAPAVGGLALAVYGVSLAWCCVSGVYLLYETNAPGESPLKSRTSGIALVASLLQMLGLVAIMLVAAPLMAGLGVIWSQGAWAWGWLLLAAGILWGTGLCWAGIQVGGRLLDRRGVAVLTTVRGWPGHAETR